MKETEISGMHPSTWSLGPRNRGLSVGDCIPECFCPCIPFNDAANMVFNDSFLFGFPNTRKEVGADLSARYPLGEIDHWGGVPWLRLLKVSPRLHKGNFTTMFYIVERLEYSARLQVGRWLQIEQRATTLVDSDTSDRMDTLAGASFSFILSLS